MGHVQSGLAALNARNREFWANQSALLTERTSNPDLLKAALGMMEFEELLPLRQRRSFEAAIEAAHYLQLSTQGGALIKVRTGGVFDPEVPYGAGTTIAQPQSPAVRLDLPTASPARLKTTPEQRRDVMRELGRVGGKASKLDALGKLIQSIVRKRPKIALRELLKALKCDERGEVIDEIDDAHLYFKTGAKDKDGHPKIDKSPLSGLKDRLRRIKISLEEERSRAR